MNNKYLIKEYDLLLLYFQHQLKNFQYYSSEALNVGLLILLFYVLAMSTYLMILITNLILVLVVFFMCLHIILMLCLLLYVFVCMIVLFVSLCYSIL